MDSNKTPNGKSTRRPARTNAGLRPSPAGFVNTEKAIEPSYESSDLDSDDDKPKGRKRYRQPFIPPAAPILKDALHYGKELTVAQSSLEPEIGMTAPRDSIPQPFTFQTVPKTISLTFNVPQGHTGPFVVNLDLNEIIAKEQEAKMPPFKKLKLQSSREKADSVRRARGRRPPLGFVDQPAELRLAVYKALFISKDKIDFVAPDLSLSSQFLRTCRTVYLEGASVLYGENKFFFRRDLNCSGPLWTKPWYETGYRNIRLWLITIGPDMIELLRYIHFAFEDGYPSQTQSRDHIPLFRNPRENIRYVHDAQLVECLKMLARHGQLKELIMSFTSRKSLCARDDRFISYLRMIKADRVVVEPRRLLSYPRLAIDLDAEHHLIASMQRTHKQYTITKAERERMEEDTKGNGKAS